VKGFIECQRETTKKLNIADEGLAALLRIQGLKVKGKGTVHPRTGHEGPQRE
jgi:hypothetical protein